MRLEMGMGSEVASLVGGGGSAISNCPPPAVPPHAAHRRPSLSLPVTPDASSSTAQRLLDRADNPAPMWDGPVRGVPRPLQDRLSDGMGEAAPPSTRPAQWAPLGSRASVPARRHSSSQRPPDHPSFAVFADTMGPVIGHPLRGVGHTALSGRVPLRRGGDSSTALLLSQPELASLVGCRRRSKRLGPHPHRHPSASTRTSYAEGGWEWGVVRGK